VTIRVVRPGLFTTVQDTGRRGHQHVGVPEGGAMDVHAARLANLLVGNDDTAAVLEATLTGPLLVFDRECNVALGGADFGARLDGETLPPWRSVRARAGATLDVVAPRHDVPHGGCRAYVAIDGGIDVPVVLGSRSTCLVAGFGGMNGRPLKTGDVLPLGAPGTAPQHALAPPLAGKPSQGAQAPPLAGRLSQRAQAPALLGRPSQRILAPAFVPQYHGVLRLVGGEHFESLDPAARDALFTAEFRVSPRSDRMGYRLDGPALSATPSPDLLSAAVTMGCLQLPPGGAPILLMADRQTTGGYPLLGQVATVDLGSAAQLRPGDTLRFEHISLEAAQRLYLERERDFDTLRHALAHSI
jgi:antagonist of KipI